MDTERMEEIKHEQRELNSVLGKWTTKLPEEHYDSLKNTLLGMMSYVMNDAAKKPKRNPLVDMYK